MRIKPGYGYWDITTLPLGGCFRRAGDTGVELVEVELVKLGRNFYGADSAGTTADGRKVAFHSAHTHTGHAEPA